MLGIKIRTHRKKRGLTLSKVSKDTGISLSFLSDIERGRTKPSLLTLEKLAKYFEVEEKDLLTSDLPEGNDQKNPSLNEFLKEIDVEPEVVELLLRINHRSSKPAKTVEDWKKYYYTLKSILD